MPGSPFSWTHAGNYPAGPNAWNGQPLSVAPAQRYFTPNLKIPAENVNEVLGEVADDSTYLHGAVGKYNLLNVYLQQVGTLLGSSWSSTAVGSTSFTTLASTTITNVSSGANFLATDFIEIEWLLSLVTSNAGAVSISAYLGLATEIGGGTLTVVAGNQVQVYSQPNTYPATPLLYKCWGLASNLLGTGGAAPGTMNIALQGAKAAGGDPSTTFNLFGFSVLAIKHYRAN